MIPEKTQVAVKGNLPLEGRRMDFDPTATANLMSLLIDMYSDKELAVLRELSCNARDSHVMANKAAAPIVVQLPSSLSPFLIIRDEGLGLTKDDVFDLFGRYGASTKRESNEATGMFGIGSKSPLTYTNQFTMTATKDGTKHVFSISRDEDGVGKITPVAEVPVTDPNGVEIKIPARTPNQFETKAKTFFKYWPKGTVALNGKDPSGLPDDALWVTKQIALYPTHVYGEVSTIVMGNVPYPAPKLDSSTLGVPHSYAVTAWVPMGAVEIAPSREALADGPKTTAAIESIRKDFIAGLQAAIQQKIEKATSMFEAMKALDEWEKLYSKQNLKALTWKGKPIIQTLEAPSNLAKNRWGGQEKVYTGNIFQMPLYSGASKRVYNQGKLALSDLLQARFVTGFIPGQVTVTTRKKMNQWLANQPSTGADIRYNYTVDFPVDELKAALPADRFVDWSVIKAEKLPKVTHLSSGRIPGSFDVLLGGSKVQWPISKYGMPGKDIDQKNPIYWTHGNHNDATWYCDILNDTQKHYSIVCLPENRIAKFKRENPTILKVEDVVKAMAKKLSDAMTSDQKKALWMAHNVSTYGNCPTALKPFINKIDDPAIKEWVRLGMINVDALKIAKQRYSQVHTFPETQVKHPATGKYSFWDYAKISAHSAEFIRYLNNEYAFKQKGKP